MSDPVTFNRDKKFDLQLSQALIDEKRLGEIFTDAKIEKIELKSEMIQWEQTGNICIEISNGGMPSGITVTEADYWVHELKRPATRPGESFTLVYLMFPIARLRRLVKQAMEDGRVRRGRGDGGRSDVVLIRLRDILQ